MHSEILKNTLTSATTAYGLSQYIGVGDFVASNVVSGVAGAAPTVDVDLQDSPDGSNVSDANATWYTLLSFTQRTTNEGELKAFTGPHFGRVRAKMTTGGTITAATCTVVISDKRADQP